MPVITFDVTYLLYIPLSSVILFLRNSFVACTTNRSVSLSLAKQSSRQTKRNSGFMVQAFRQSTKGSATSRHLTNEKSAGSHVGGPIKNRYDRRLLSPVLEAVVKKKKKKKMKLSINLLQQ